MFETTNQEWTCHQISKIIKLCRSGLKMVLQSVSMKPGGKKTWNKNPAKIGETCCFFDIISQACLYDGLMLSTIGAPWFFWSSTGFTWFSCWIFITSFFKFPSDLLPLQLCAFSKFHILIDAQFVVFSYVAAAILHSSLFLATKSKPSITVTAPHDLSHPVWITFSPSSKALIKTWHQLNLWHLVV